MAKKKEDWTPSRKPGQDSGPSGASIKWSTGTRLTPGAGNKPSANLSGAFESMFKRAASAQVRSANKKVINQALAAADKKAAGVKVGDTIKGKATARFANNPLRVTGVSNQGKRGTVITAVDRSNRSYTFSESDVCRDELGQFASC